MQRLLIAAVVLAGLLGCDLSQVQQPAPPAPAAAPTAGLQNHGTRTVPVFQLDLNPSLTDSLTIVGLSDRIMKQIVSMRDSGLLKEALAVNFEIFAEVEDRYGNKSRDKVMWMQFRQEDLSKINWDSMTNWKLMEFCYPSVINPSMKGVLLNYCDSSTVRAFAPSFEGRVRSGRG